jgi:drug/metabolite transporter (DMT)-like permease
VIAAVLASAALHATWNFLLRRAGGGTLIVALSKVAEAVLLLPVAITVLSTTGPLPPFRFIPVVIVASVLALANYAALSAAYRLGDLSLVYPIARGAVFLFLPVLGFLAFAEQLGRTGWLALGLIVAGIALLPLAAFDKASVLEVGRHLRSRAVVFALFAALATACYTIWDKYAVGFLDPFLYFYGYTLLLALAFGVVIARTEPGEARAAWRGHPVSIVMIGLLNAGAYLLILLALREGMATQVLAVRQLSIPIGVILGWQLLRERLTPARAIGALMITAGCALAAAI